MPSYHTGTDSAEDLSCLYQCFGSGSGLDPDSIRSVDLDADPGGQK